MAFLPTSIRRLARTATGITLGLSVIVPFAGSANADDTYTVVGGDTLLGIAASNGVAIDALLAENGLTLSSVIHPGQRLSIPDAAPVASGTSHTVVAGDTLGGIATAAGVTLSDLLSVNGLSASSLIMPGDTVAIPAGGAATGTSSSFASPSAAVAPSPSTGNRKVDAVLQYALAQVGKPYVFFTKGASTFDCSGLTLMAYGQVGVELVHHAATQAQQGIAVDHWNQSIQAGDLVFLDGDWDGVIDHVGIATSATTWVHASQTHQRVVTDSLPSDSVIVAVRRYV